MEGSYHDGGVGKPLAREMGVRRRKRARIGRNARDSNSFFFGVTWHASL